MKVLLFSAFGKSLVTKEISDILGKSEFPKNRCGEIISYIENHSVDMIGKSEKELFKYLKSNYNNIAKVHSSVQGSIFCIYNYEFENISNFSILEVDTSRPWTISNYDGSEYIKYLDDYKLKDKELNYYGK